MPFRISAMDINQAMNKPLARATLRDLGVVIGTLPCGVHNAITDVPGVLVGHQTVIRDVPDVVRSGVTVILPRAENIHQDPVFAGFFSLNGIGEMTGLPLLDEWGLLACPITLTSTTAVGMAWDTISRYGAQHYGGFAYKLPVVAETYDGFLNDIDRFPLVPEDVICALESAAAGPVAQGNVGGGTGMTCYEFKGGIGTASRVAVVGGQNFTVGALVQDNHGKRQNLLVHGVEVGRAMPEWMPEDPQASPPAAESSSILIIVATDAPLLPLQCRRLARRAAAGLARTGGVGYNSSGDLFLAFATGNHLKNENNPLWNVQMLPNSAMDGLIDATAEAVEEAILNALTCAETMTGVDGRKAYALPLEEMLQILSAHHVTIQSARPKEQR